MDLGKVLLALIHIPKQSKVKIKRLHVPPVYVCSQICLISYLPLNRSWINQSDCNFYNICNVSIDNSPS